MIDDGTECRVCTLGVKLVLYAFDTVLRAVIVVAMIACDDGYVLQPVSRLGLPC